MVLDVPATSSFPSSANGGGEPINFAEDQILAELLLPVIFADRGEPQATDKRDEELGSETGLVVELVELGFEGHGVSVRVEGPVAAGEVQMVALALTEDQ